jgi:hypothetical protein
MTTMQSLTFDHILVALGHRVNHESACQDCNFVARALIAVSEGAVQRLPTDVRPHVSAIVRDGGRFVAQFEGTIHRDRVVFESQHMAGFGRVACDVCLGSMPCERSMLINIPMTPFDMAVVSSILVLRKGLDAGRVTHRTDADRDAGARMLFSAYLLCRAYAGVPPAS